MIGLTLPCSALIPISLRMKTTQGLCSLMGDRDCLRSNKCTQSSAHNVMMRSSGARGVCESYYKSPQFCASCLKTQGAKSFRWSPFSLSLSLSLSLTWKTHVLEVDEWIYFHAPLMSLPNEDINTQITFSLRHPSQIWGFSSEIGSTAYFGFILRLCLFSSNELFHDVSDGLRAYVPHRT